MKIIHFSDTHLGYNDLDALNEENVNQREADFYDAFSQVVAQIKKTKPDYIIHTGDLFHRSSPSNRAITFALERFKIINALKIPFILIAGNHSTPRTNLSSPILKIFESFENVYAAYSQKYEAIEFKDVVFHALPHMNDTDKADEQIELCESSVNPKKKNVMMLHCSVGSHYLMQEFGEWVYPKEKEWLFDKMDYVALGHWHGFGSVGKRENVFYSGSTERTSLNDKRNSKGFIELDLGEKGSLFGELQVEFKEINIRKILTKKIDCEDYENSLEALNAENTQDAIVEVKLINLTPLQSIEIQNAQIKKLFPNAMNVSVKREFKLSKGENETLDVQALSLQEYFLEHVKEDASDKEFSRLKNKIDELFTHYEESCDDSH